MITEKTFISQRVVIIALLTLLSACAPDKPEGADSEGMGRIADQLRSHGDDTGAVDFYQRDLQRSPNDTKARTSLAEILEAHGDYASAAAQYRQVLQLEPDNGDVHRDLGRVLIHLNQPAQAKDQYERALEVDHSDVKAMNGLGISLDYLGNHEAAQKVYKDALDEKSDDLSALNNLGHSYVLVGAYNEAIKLLEPHIKDKGATPALRQNLAEAYGMAGMDADAERVGLMDLPPDQVKHNIAYYHARREQLSVAPKLYADLGSFATEAMADARQDKVKSEFSKESAGLVIEVMPEVKVIGGTPSFGLRASGFARADKLRGFCDKLTKAGLACKAHGA